MLSHAFFTTGAVIVFALTLSGCLYLAEPPPGLSGGASVAGGSSDGSSADSLDDGTTDVCDDLESCCDMLQGFDSWAVDSCHNQATNGENSCATALCNWAAQESSCVDLACDAGCAIDGC